MKNKNADIKNIRTLANFKRSVEYAISAGHKGRAYQYKVLHAAFKRTEEIMARRSKEAGFSEPNSQEIISTTNNEKHRLVLKMLLVDKLKPKQIINLKDAKGEYLFKSNRGKKYSIRTIQKIRENALEKVMKKSTHILQT